MLLVKPVRLYFLSTQFAPPRHLRAARATGLAPEDGGGYNSVGYTRTRAKYSCNEPAHWSHPTSARSDWVGCTGRGEARGSRELLRVRGASNSYVTVCYGPARSCLCLSPAGVWSFASFLGELPDTLLLRLVVAVRAPPSSSGSHNLCLTGTRLQWLPQRTHGCEGSHCLGSSTADRSHCPSRLRL